MPDQAGQLVWHVTHVVPLSDVFEVVDTDLHPEFLAEILDELVPGHGADGQESNDGAEVAHRPPVGWSVTQGYSMSHDWDTWCESGYVCTRKISPYIAEVKGNGAYGNRDGYIGAFDQAMRQNFYGSWPRWRVHLNWDDGPTVNGYDFYVNCKKHVPDETDPKCGSNWWDPPPIGNGFSNAWDPSPTGLKFNANGLTGSANKYHDDFFGKFHANGYSLEFRTGTLHTGRWKYCGACKYYQVPWTENP